MSETLKFGVFTEDCVRELVKNGIHHAFHHYKGQMVISNGVATIILDDFMVDSDEEEAIDLLNRYFLENLQIRNEQLANLKTVDPNINKVPDDLSFFSNHSNYPIGFFDNFQLAKVHHHPAPEHRKVASSKPVTLQ